MWAGKGEEGEICKSKIIPPDVRQEPLEDGGSLSASLAFPPGRQHWRTTRCKAVSDPSIQQGAKHEQKGADVTENTRPVGNCVIVVVVSDREVGFTVYVPLCAPIPSTKHKRSNQTDVAPIVSSRNLASPLP